MTKSDTPAPAENVVVTPGYRLSHWKDGSDELEAALDAFWNAAYQQGQQQRGHDDEQGSAQAADTNLRQVIANEVAAEHERCNAIVRAAWGENISLEKMEAATTWHEIATVPTDERLILIGSYNGRGQWCSEVWSTRYLRDQVAKSADGFFLNAPHLEWLPTHWAELPAPPALSAQEAEG